MLSLPHVEAGGKIEEFTVSNSEPAALVTAESGQMGAAAEPAQSVEDGYGLNLDAIYREASEIAGQRLTTTEQVVLAMASQMSYDDLHPVTKEKVDSVRQATVPKFNAHAIASDLMSQYRQKQQSLQTA